MFVARVSILIVNNRGAQGYRSFLIAFAKRRICNGKKSDPGGGWRVEGGGWRGVAAKKEHKKLGEKEEKEEK